MRMKEAVKTYKPLIEQALREVIRERAKKYGRSMILRRFYEDLEEFVLRGGKRLRPLSFIMAFRGVRDPKDALGDVIRASTSIEFLHNAALVHDDIIDQDTIRRGGPTFHIKYEKFYESIAPLRAKLYGLSFGILGGDELFNIGVDVLLKVSFPAERRLEALSYYVMAYSEMVNGEALDLHMAVSDYEKLKEKDYFNMVLLKTGSLFEKGILMGLALAGANKKVKEMMSKYARNMAIAFQIQDDILGLFGEEEVIGKPVGSDLREGKATLLIVRAVQVLDKTKKEKLLSMLGKKDISKEEVAEAQDMMREYGVLDYARRVARGMADQAIDIIERCDITDDSKEFFRDLADYVISRLY
ncbi:MAG: hypothetical protein DRN15_00620 [Thermoprotei archaeon]|nr:MAG: hypothetical protein DRN15_00620 [Thermoprotei archaeon]